MDGYAGLEYVSGYAYKGRLEELGWRNGGNGMKGWG